MRAMIKRWQKTEESLAMAVTRSVIFPMGLTFNAAVSSRTALRTNRCTTVWYCLRTSQELTNQPLPALTLVRHLGRFFSLEKYI